MANNSITWDTQTIDAVKKRFVAKAIIMGRDIQALAAINAPKLSGNLASTIRTVPREYGADVIAGGIVGKADKSKGIVDYAYIREKYNNKHPDTRFYMQRALKTTFTGDWANKYFRRII